jgi:hypothetical protein
MERHGTSARVLPPGSVDQRRMSETVGCLRKYLGHPEAATGPSHRPFIRRMQFLDLQLPLRHNRLWPARRGIEPVLGRISSSVRHQMTTPVSVAVFIDRSEAIRAGHNKWDWQNTELDLETLDARLREALSRCPEKNGALQITHSEIRPGSEPASPWHRSSWLLGQDLRDSFELEREGMPTIVEATPITALQMLEHLASLPSRLHAQGASLLSSAQALAATRGAQSTGQAEVYLTDLDQWLSTAPNQLLTEHEEHWSQPLRFQPIEAPQPPTLATLLDEQIAYDLEEARRLLDGQWPRVSDARPGDNQSTLDFFANPRPKTTPEHLIAAEEVLAQGIQARTEAVRLHRRAIAAVAQKHFQAWQSIQHERAQEDRLIATLHAQQTLKAHKEATNNKALKEWSVTYDKPGLLKLLEAGAPAEQITSTLRLIVFEPLANFAAFRKIRKQDLLIANPNFDDKASGLGAAFDDIETEFTDPNHLATARAIMNASWAANIPSQFAFRLHRGRLTRREEAVGVPLEARSLLLTAHFGDLRISRAFEIGTLGPSMI